MIPKIHSAIDPIGDGGFVITASDSMLLERRLDNQMEIRRYFESEYILPSVITTHSVYTITLIDIKPNLHLIV